LLTISARPPQGILLGRQGANTCKERTLLARADELIE
jgi:hypothetical protein